MTKVLQAVTDGTDSSYIRKSFSPQTEVWVTASVGFTQAAADVWTSDPTGATSFSGDMLLLFSSPDGISAGIDGAGPGIEWYVTPALGTSTSPAPTPDSFQTLEIHFTASSTAEFYVDGTLAVSGATASTTADEVLVGLQGEAPTSADSILYVEYVLVGTTRGGSEIFSDHFEDGTLDAWDITSGSVSVITTPTFGGGGGGSTAHAPSRDWRWDLCDRYGFVIETLDPYVMDRQLVFNLNRPCSAYGKVAANSPVVNTLHGDGVPYLSAGDRTLKCWRFENDNWTLRFAGIVWQLEDAGDEDSAYTTFTAFDPFQFLFKRMIRRNDGNLKKTVTLANNAAAAIKRHIDKTIFYAGECYIDTDDGFFEPGLVYLTFQYEQEYLARAFMEVCDTGVVDVTFAPVDRTDGILVTASAVEKRGSDKSDTVIFEYDTGGHVAQQWTRELDMESAANTITNFSGNKKKTSFQSDSDSQTRFGVMEDCRVLTDIVHQDFLDSLTSQELSERKNPRENINVLPLPETGPVVFEDYDIGDEIGVVCSDSAREAVSGIQRIYGFNLDIDNEGVERVTELRVSPQLG
jgi:hypothetical protein